MVVTDQFRRDLAAWLAIKGNSQVKLAKDIGCSQSMISALLHSPDRTRTSDLVEPICRVTGIALPHARTPITERDLDFIERMHELEQTAPDTYRAVMLLLGAPTNK